jgi:hypothetical protein
VPLATASALSALESRLTAMEQSLRQLNVTSQLDRLAAHVQALSSRYDSRMAVMETALNALLHHLQIALPHPGLNSAASPAPSSATQSSSPQLAQPAMAVHSERFSEDVSMIGLSSNLAAAATQALPALRTSHISASAHPAHDNGSAALYG